MSPMRYQQHQPFSGAVAPNFKDDDLLMGAPAVPTGATAEPDPDVSQDGPLALNTRVEYAALQRGQTQTVFGLVTVQAAAATVSTADASIEERQPMDIVCVLDVSGSMDSSNKIEDLKSAVRFIIDEARPPDRLSIVTFNSAAIRKLRLRRMDSTGRDEATKEVLLLNAEGGTSIAAGLDMGLAVLEQRRQRNKVSTILLLTDGQDGSTRAALPALIKRAAQIGCSVYGFGFGADHDADLLREISEHARTPYTYVETTNTIRQAFAGVVGGLSSIVAQNVEITLNCHVPLTTVNTPFEVRRNGDRWASVTIPDIFAGERRDVLLEFSVPAELHEAGPDGSTLLLEASARYIDLRKGGSSGLPVQCPPVLMTVQRVEESQPELEPDVEVTDQRERVHVTRVLEEAANHSDSGNFEEAQKLLRETHSQITTRKTQTPVAEALRLELEDAQHRMQGRSAWLQGQAEVKDAFQMHKMQRCTNATSSASAQVCKSSKMMYQTPCQMDWIQRSTPASSSGA